MNIINKFIFWIRKPKLLLIFGEEESFQIKNILFYLLKKEKKIFILNNFEKKLNKKSLKFLIKNSSSSLIIYNGEKKEIRDLVPQTIICKFEKLEELSFVKKSKILTVGFNSSSDFIATELNLDEETNFKIVREGDIVPFWINKDMNKKELSNILLAIGASDLVSLNLIQISQKLKNIDISKIIA